MGLDREILSRSLYEESLSNSLCFLRHFGLVRIGPHMFNHRIGKDHVELIIFEARQIPSISYAGIEILTRCGLLSDIEKRD